MFNFWLLSLYKNASNEYIVAENEKEISRILINEAVSFDEAIKRWKKFKEVPFSEEITIFDTLSEQEETKPAYEWIRVYGKGAIYLTC